MDPRTKWGGRAHIVHLPPRHYATLDIGQLNLRDYHFIQM